MDTWTIQLVSSLLLLKYEAWEVNFDPDEEEDLQDADIDFMLEAICTS